MPYKASKIYYDGSHYIAVPKENFPSRKCGKTARKSNSQTDSVKAKFETAYAESQALPKCERKQYIAERLQNDFATVEEAKEYARRQTERKRNNACKRYTRLWRKVYLQGRWDYFVTLTYDNAKHTEESFRQSLRNTLKHLVSRKGWKYMGAWERGETGRLHFHALLNIPEGTMSGEVEKRREYDPVRKRMVTYSINTFFEKTFGRNTFDKLSSLAMRYSKTAEYIVKYLEKDGGRLICSRGLDTFIETEVDSEDIICPLHPYESYDDRKYILFDDFKVWSKNGKCLGAFNRSLLPLLKLVS